MSDVTFRYYNRKGLFKMGYTTSSFTVFYCNKLIKCFNLERCVNFYVHDNPWGGIRKRIKRVLNSVVKFFVGVIPYTQKRKGFDYQWGCIRLKTFYEKQGINNV